MRRRRPNRHPARNRRGLLLRARINSSQPFARKARRSFQKRRRKRSTSTHMSVCTSMLWISGPKTMKSRQPRQGSARRTGRRRGLAVPPRPHLVTNSKTRSSRSSGTASRRFCRRRVRSLHSEASKESWLRTALSSRKSTQRARSLRRCRISSARWA